MGGLVCTRPARYALHMDAHLFRRFCDIITPFLQCARVEKIQEAAPDALVLACHAPGQRKYICLKYGRRDPFIFATARRIAGVPKPSAAVMRMRRHAQGRRLGAVVSQFCQRKLWLMPTQDAGDGRLAWLCLDLAAGASVHFLLPGESPAPDEPSWPGPSDIAGALERWRDWPVLGPALRRSLARMDTADQWALLEDLRMGGGDIFLYARPGGSGGIVRASAWPLAPAEAGGLVESCVSDAGAALELAGQDLVLRAMASRKDGRGLLPLRRRLRRLEDLKTRLEGDELRLNAMLSRKDEALAIQASLWRLARAPAGSVIELDCGAGGGKVRFQLLPGERPAEAMERLFHMAARGARGLEHLRGRRDSVEEELNRLRKVLDKGIAPPGREEAMDMGLACQAAALAARLPKNVQIFVSGDGFAMLRGRDARGNLAARRLASPHDIWLHAANGPGSHVIIRRFHSAQEVPERTLDEAGCLAACKSWLAGAATARILYAELRHVRAMRNAPAGTVRIDRVFATREVAVDHGLEARLGNCQINPGAA